MQNPRRDTLEAWTALLVAHRRLVTELDTDLRLEAGMSLDDYDVLFQLRKAASPVPMNELADHLLISRASTTRVVDRLVQHGWIDRRHDDRDRRRVLVELTDGGRRAQAAAGRVHLRGIARLVELPLEGHDITALTASLLALGGGRAAGS